MELEPANWKPLELLIGSRCVEFMWMWRENGLEYYKHIDEVMAKQLCAFVGTRWKQ